MLICNYSYINQICGHNHSGITNPVWIIQPHTMRGYYSSCDVTTSNICNQKSKDSFPTGTNPPYSIILGDKGALLSSTTTIYGVGTTNINISQGINVSSNLTGTCTITDAQLSLIIQLASALSGDGNITVASLVGVVSLASSISSTGSLTAGLGLMSFMTSILNGTSSVNASLRGTLAMSADIYVNKSQATVNELVDGVWNALTVDYNNLGTTGAALNAAGTAGDPWITTLPGAYPAGSAGDIIGNLLANIPDSVWDELKSGHTTPDTYGKIVQDLETLIKQVKSLTAAQL